MCCGQKRATMASHMQAPTPPKRSVRVAGTLPPHATTAASAVRLRYLGRAQLSVRGPVSGRAHEVSGESPEIQVDVRDAVALEQTGYFQRL